MIVHLIIIFLALFLVCYSRNKKLGLKWACSFVALFLSIRYYWGNDYTNYVSFYQEFNQLDFGLFDIERSSTAFRNQEWGWVILNRVYGATGLGFFGLIITLSIFECWVMYRTIVKFLEPKYYWIAVVFWLFTDTFCINASMIRQYLCICLYLLVVDLMIHKKGRFYLVWSIAIILIGSTIHRAILMAFVSLPFYYIHVKHGRKTIVFSIAVGLLFVVWSLTGRQLLEPYLLLFLEGNDDFSYYMNYVGQESSGVGTGIGLVFQYMTLTAWLFLLPYLKREQQVFAMLIIFSYFFEVVGDIAPIFQRLALFFSAVSIITWSYFITYGKRWEVLYVLFGIEIIMLIRIFYGFYHSALWGPHYYHYHTIFEANGWM